MLNILLLGSTGKMGTALSRVLGRRHRVTGLCSAQLDAGDFDAVRRRIAEGGFQAVINTIAFVGVDPCERDPARALHLNALLPRNLARWSHELDYELVHFSTDAVFSGDKGGEPYDETDTPSPVNVYGMTKYTGDVLVAEQGGRCHVARIGILFGDSTKRNQLFEKMVDAVKGGRTPLRLATDAVASPTSSLDVAEEIAGWLERGHPYGLHHVTNRGQASLYDFIRHALAALGLEAEIQPALQSEFPSLARKSTYIPLTSRGIRLRPWREALDDYCRTLRAGSE